MVFEGVTEALICTWQVLLFGYLMYRNRFEQVWMAWYLKNTEFEDGNSETPYEVHPLYGYFVCHVQDIYKSEQYFSIREAMILWKGCL